MKFNLFSLMVTIFSHILTTINCIELYSDDPDIDRNSSELIESRGFRSETHHVITRDGYVLTLFRIINPFLTDSWNLYPIYIQYGLLGNSDQLLVTRHGVLAENGSYVEEGGHVNNCFSNDSVAQTLPFVLSACGYDVWVGNFRGSEYSSHLLLNQFKDRKYWSYSLDQMSAYDLTSNLNYILSATNQKTVGYIGYSLGNTLMFQLLSTQTEYSKLIKPFISLGSFVYLGHIRSPLLRPLELLEPLLRSMDIRLGGLDRLQPLFGKYFCGNQLFKVFCVLIYSLIGGFDYFNLNIDLIPRLYAHFPSGISSTALAQVGQRIHFNSFSFYNYGNKKNHEIYGQTSAPNYNLSKIDSEYIILMSGKNDFLSDQLDVDLLRSQLKVNPFSDIEVPDPYWTHGDFVYANSAGKYINAPILRQLESVFSNK